MDFRFPENSGEDPHLFLGEAAWADYLGGLAEAERVRATLAAKTLWRATRARVAGSSVVIGMATRARRWCQRTGGLSKKVADRWTIAKTAPRRRTLDYNDYLARLQAARGNWKMLSRTEALPTSMVNMPRRATR